MPVQRDRLSRAVCAVWPDGAAVARDRPDGGHDPAQPPRRRRAPLPSTPRPLRYSPTNAIPGATEIAPSPPSSSPLCPHAPQSHPRARDRRRRCQRRWGTTRRIGPRSIRPSSPRFTTPPRCGPAPIRKRWAGGGAEGGGAVAPGAAGGPARDARAAAQAQRRPGRALGHRLDCPALRRRRWLRGRR